MATTQVAPEVSGTSTTSTRGFSILDTLILVSLGGAAIDYLVPGVTAFVATHHLIPPLIIAIPYVIALAVVATRWRWAMVVSLIIGLAALVLHLSPGFPLYAMTHPASDYHTFADIIIQPPLLLLVVGASVVKLAQTLRHDP